MPSKITPEAEQRVTSALDRFRIELPSWGFANTGTRFGRFEQDAAATTLEHKLHDAGHVHKLTAACPTVAVHVLWDFDDPSDPASAETTAKLADEHGVKIGSINPNLFQDQQYKLGSLCSPFADVRERAMKHVDDSIALGSAVGSTSLAMWMADGTNYPGQDNIRRRFEALKAAYRQMAESMKEKWPGSTLLVEYKPFEPAFYHTDIPDWGAALVLSRHAGDNAKVLVDTGHHLPGCNIEQIVALLLGEGRLGGFHFNDRKYADDDLTLGSIDPYAVFRIFNEIAQYAHDTGNEPNIEYMVDQSHNVKPKLEATVQTATEAQKLYAKARLVDRRKLASCQSAGDIVGAELCLKEAYETDVTPILKEYREGKGLPADPLATLREEGHVARLGKERRERHGKLSESSYA